MNSFTSLSDNMVGFVQILRHLGVRVSTAEALDAIESLKIIDPLEKSQFRAALKSTLIKNSQDQASFYKAFNLFFVESEVKAKQKAEFDAKLEQEHLDTIKADEELVFQGNPLDIPDELKEVYKKLPEQNKDRLQDFLAKTSDGKKVDESFQPVVENIIKSSLSFWHRQLPEEDLAQLAEAKRERLGQAELDSVINSAASMAGQTGKGKNPLLLKNMQSIAENEVPQVTTLIKRLAHKLTNRISRRFRRSAKRRFIDIRQSIRRNMRYGGAMIALKYKAKKIRKPSIVVLCDVSSSMTKYVRFTLPLLYGLSSAVRNIESFVFANDLERATDYFQRGANFLKATEKLLENSSQMGQGTNLFVALTSLKENHANLLASSTILFIISDAKTLFPQETISQMNIINQKVKQIIWLNTQPVENWSQNSAIGEYKKYCSMHECYHLAHLADILLNLKI